MDGIPATQDNTDLLTAMIAGSGAAVVQTVVTYPFEYVKTTSQIANSSLLKTPYHIPTDSVRSLFIGCNGLALGNALKASSRFLIFNRMTQFMGTDNSKANAPRVVVAGLMTGFLETLWVIPVENVKTRMIENAMEKQGYRLPLPSYAGATGADGVEKPRLTKRPLESKPFNPRQKYIDYYGANPSTTFFRAVKEIYETTGLSGFKRAGLPGHHDTRSEDVHAGRSGQDVEWMASAVDEGVLQFVNHIGDLRNASEGSEQFDRY
ncbi:hypothetical protein KL948_003005 [Ogataea haglerorum]|nr:hypothetical protein KL948_003005 [Ogataea haglerorum]